MTSEEYDILIQRIDFIRDEFVDANDEIAYVNIKGKDYAEVKEKIKAFRKVFPEGSISTKIISVDEQTCLIKAEVFNENGSLLATGHAFEQRSSLKDYLKDYMIEITETSAIGRALSYVGFGIKDGVASADSMERSTKKDETRNRLLICHRCGRQISDCQDNKGKVWRAEDISHITIKHYGDSLCFPCLKELKAEKTEIEV